MCIKFYDLYDNWGILQCVAPFATIYTHFVCNVVPWGSNATQHTIRICVFVCTYMLFNVAAVIKFIASSLCHIVFVFVSHHCDLCLSCACFWYFTSLFLFFPFRWHSFVAKHKIHIVFAFHVMNLPVWAVALAFNFYYYYYWTVLRLDVINDGERNLRRKTLNLRELMLLVLLLFF